MALIPFLLFPFSYSRSSLLPQNYSCTYKKVLLCLTAGVTSFVSVAITIAASIAIIIAAF